MCAGYFLPVFDHGFQVELFVRVHCPSSATLVAFVQRADEIAFPFLTWLYFFFKRILHCHCMFQFMGEVGVHVFFYIESEKGVCFFTKIIRVSFLDLVTATCILTVFFFLQAVSPPVLWEQHIFMPCFFALCLRAGPRLVPVYC